MPRHRRVLVYGISSRPPFNNAPGVTTRPRVSLPPQTFPQRPDSALDATVEQFAPQILVRRESRPRHSPLYAEYVRETSGERRGLSARRKPRRARRERIVKPTAQRRGIYKRTFTRRAFLPERRALIPVVSPFARELYLAASPSHLWCTPVRLAK